MNTLDLTTLTLASGGHDGANDGFCLLEAAAYVAGEKWTDQPKCVCSVLGAFGRNLNDVLPDDKRQQLIPLIPELLHTRGDGHAEARSYMALDWLVRTYLPGFLALTDRIDAETAQGLRDLAPIVDVESARAAGVLVRAARDKASAARDAAGDAARDAARDAAGDAARAAAGAAAWDAAGAAAGAAARDAAGDAAGAAAGDAARAAARAAAWDAARAAARAAAWDAAGAAAGAAARDAARDAAWDAAWDAARAAATKVLAPTVAELQDSAIDLYTRMVR